MTNANLIASKARDLALKNYFHLNVDSPVNLLGGTDGDIELRCTKCNKELRISLENLPHTIRNFEHEKYCIVSYILDIYAASNEAPRNTP